MLSSWHTQGVIFRTCPPLVTYVIFQRVQHPSKGTRRAQRMCPSSDVRRVCLRSRTSSLGAHVQPKTYAASVPGRDRHQTYAASSLERVCQQEALLFATLLLLLTQGMVPRSSSVTGGWYDPPVELRSSSSSNMTSRIHCPAGQCPKTSLRGRECPHVAGQ